MSFLELANKRFSVRVFEAKPVPREILEQVLEAGRLAPTAANKQPFHVVVLQDEERRRALGVAYPRDWFWRTPVILVLCVDASKAWARSDSRNYADVDGAIAMDHMTLCAADLGLGTCWIGAFDPVKVRRILNLPDHVEPLVMTPLGYPAEPVRSKSRKPLSDLVHYENW